MASEVLPRVQSSKITRQPIRKLKWLTWMKPWPYSEFPQPPYEGSNNCTKLSNDCFFASRMSG